MGADVAVVNAAVVNAASVNGASVEGEAGAVFELAAAARELVLATAGTVFLSTCPRGCVMWAGGGSRLKGLG